MNHLDIEFDFIVEEIDGIRKNKKYHTAKISGEFADVCFRFGSVVHYSTFKTSDVAIYLNSGIWRMI